jgi:glutathione S-transferase
MSAKKRAARSKSRTGAEFPHRRPAKPALGRGRVQLAARRAFVCGDTISTADAAMFAYCRKTLVHGRRLAPHDYRLLRQALALIAIPIGRGDGTRKANAVAATGCDMSATRWKYANESKGYA